MYHAYSFTILPVDFVRCTHTHTERHQDLACFGPNRKAEKSINEHHRNITGASHVPFPMTRHKLQDQGPNCPFLDL